MRWVSVPAARESDRGSSESRLDPACREYRQTHKQTDIQVDRLTNRQAYRQGWRGSWEREKCVGTVEFSHGFTWGRMRFIWGENYGRFRPVKLWQHMRGVGEQVTWVLLHQRLQGTRPRILSRGNMVTAQKGREFSCSYQPPSETEHYLRSLYYLSGSSKENRLWSVWA